MKNESKHFRTVRSFVKRTGRLSESQKKALDDAWQGWVLEIGDEPYDFSDVFGRDSFATLEIGFGMGHALLQLAEENPSQNFVGVEVHLAGIANVLKGIEEKSLSNIRLFQVDAIDVLKQCVVDDTFDKVLLLFPDPWHKTRHHKRRLVQPEFLSLVSQKLKPSGIFHVATDWQDYAQHVLEVMADCNEFTAVVPKEGYNVRPEDRPMTKYEQRGLRLGHKIWDLTFLNH